MTTLLIIEAPGKRKKLESILGAGYAVRASGGHIRDLPQKDIGIDPETLRLKYVAESARSKKSIAELKTAAAAADRVLLATDPDREGEAIAWHIADVLKPQKRAKVRRSHRQGRETAVAAPLPLDMNLVHAQRRGGRWIASSAGASAARCPTRPARACPPAASSRRPSTWSCSASERSEDSSRRSTTARRCFVTDGAAWSAQWQTKPHLGPAATTWLTSPSPRSPLVSAVRVVDFADTQAKSAPPAPFTTSTLQQRAHGALKSSRRRRWNWRNDSTSRA
jgi:DNA topoisomerase-1